MRQSPNLRREARGRPQLLQRLRWRTANLGLRRVLATLAVVATLGSPLPAHERHAELTEQEHRPLVVARGGGDGDVHPLADLDLVGVDLGEDQLVLDAEGVVAAAVE